VGTPLFSTQYLPTAPRIFRSTRSLSSGERTRLDRIKKKPRQGEAGLVFRDRSCCLRSLAHEQWATVQLSARGDSGALSRQKEKPRNADTQPGLDETTRKHRRWRCGGTPGWIAPIPWTERSTRLVVPQGSAASTLKAHEARVRGLESWTGRKR
jgi:hypothetical protein